MTPDEAATMIAAARQARSYACPLAWSDGWGAHVCQREAGHAGRHACRCDATTDDTNEATK